MKGAEAPLGHIAQIDPIVATGFRNQYDAPSIARVSFLPMMQTLGWYRPTRD